VGKQYQTRTAEASTAERTIPEKVLVALVGIAESAKGGLLALAVGAGAAGDGHANGIVGHRAGWLALMAGTTRTGP